MARKEGVDIEFNIREGGFNTLIEKFNEISQSFQSMEQDLKQSVKTSEIGARDLHKAFKGLFDIRDQMADSKGLTKAFEHQSRIVDNLQKEMEAVQKLAGKIHQASGKEARALEKNLRNKVDYINKQVKSTGENLKKQSENLRKVFIDDREQLNKYLTKEMPANVGKGIGQSIHSVLSGGDLHGVITNLIGTGSSLAKGGLDKWIQGRRERKAAREAAGMPTASKLGGVVQAIGRFATMLGPMLGAIGGIAMLVKILMDSEAQTKKLNKALTDSVSLYRLGEGSLERSTQRMDELRKSATSFRTNLRLGIDPEQHYEVIKALNDNNASLSQLARNYESWGQMATEVVTDVRFASLNLGTSMSEVAGFMGKMQSIHSMALPQIRENLTHIQAAAAKSGMSTQKFFSAVAQAGDQMALYNYRLDKTVSLMSDFSQLMDPESAQAFVNALTTGFKDKTPGDRLKEMAIAFEGDFDKIAEALRKSVELGVRAISEDHSDVLKSTLTGLGIDVGSGSPEDLTRAMASLSEAQRDSLYTGLSSDLDKKTANHLMMLVDDARKAYSGDTLSNIDAARNLGPVQQFGIMLQKLEKARRDSGVGSIEDVTAIVAEKYGLSEKDLEMTRRAVRDVRSELREEGLDTSIENIMNRFADKTSEQLEDMGWKEAEQRNYAEEQVAATTSITNILKYLIYDVLNRISGVTSGIYRWVAKRWGSDRARQEAKLDERYDRARGRLETLKRQQHETTDPVKAAALEAEIASAETVLQREEAQKRVFEEYSNRIYGHDGKVIDENMERKVGGLAYARAYYGYEGSLADYRKLEEETAPHEFHKTLMDLGEKSKTEESLRKKQLEYSEALQEEIEKGNTSSKHLAETFDQVAASDGLKLTSESYQKIRDAFIEAKIREETASKLERMGASKEHALGLAHSIHEGVDLEVLLENPRISDSDKNVLKRFMGGAEVPSAGDAKIMTSGVAALRFKAGDMVVDRDSLARTLRGRPGEFIPDFLKAAGAGVGTSRVGSGMVTVHNTFNINGGNVREIQDTILRTMDMVERVRNGER